MTTTITREEWLTAGMVELTDWFDARAKLAMPDVRVSVGFPAGSRGGRNHAIGQCWSASTVADGKCAIFVSPVLDDSIEVLGVLTHELVHAAVGTDCGHRGAFATAARAIGLEGKLTATHAGDELREKLQEIVNYLGDYREIHGKIDPHDRRKQGTRMLKNTCPECGSIFRSARSTVTPLCDGDATHELVRTVRDSGSED